MRLDIEQFMTAIKPAVREPENSFWDDTMLSFFSKKFHNFFFSNKVCLPHKIFQKIISSLSYLHCTNLSVDLKIQRTILGTGNFLNVSTFLLLSFIFMSLSSSWLNWTLETLFRISPTIGWASKDQIWFFCPCNSQIILSVILVPDCRQIFSCFRASHCNKFSFLFRELRRIFRWM